VYTSHTGMHLALEHCDKNSGSNSHSGDRHNQSLHCSILDIRQSHSSPDIRLILAVAGRRHVIAGYNHVPRHRSEISSPLLKAVVGNLERVARRLTTSEPESVGSKTSREYSHGDDQRLEQRERRTRDMMRDMMLYPIALGRR
jgi:hypothetical protein